MVRISKLEIENYRSCVDTSVDVNRDLTTLIGVNGAGKSNILNSIQLLKTKRPFGRNRYLRHIEKSSSQSNIKLDINVGGSRYNLKAHVGYKTDEKNVDEVDYIEISIKKDNRDSKWLEIDNELLFFVSRYGSTDELPQHYLGHKNFSDPEIKLQLKVLRYLFNISYYGATQFSDPARSPISIELENSRLPFRLYGSERPHDKFIYDLFFTWKKKKKNFKQYLNIVNKNGIGLIDDMDFIEVKLPDSSYEVKSGGKIKKVIKSKNIVIPSIHLDGLSLSPSQLSEGTFKTLALVFYILNDKSELLLIEEPEVCVHHGLLNSIVELIKSQSKKKQIIISTHSDYVLDKLKPENILLVRRDKTNGTTAKALTKSLSKNDFAALKAYLNNSGNLGEYWKEGGFENGKN